jgi:hypothetical protein
MKMRYVWMAVLTALVAAPAAIAGSVQSGYEGGAGVQNQVSQAGEVQGTAAGSLPFTGLDLALLVIGGLGLLVIGMVVRRAAAKRGV